MIKLRLLILLGVVVGLVSSCEWDNYDEPGSFLQGRIVYQGEPIHVSYNDVFFQLWEPGWQLDIPIEVTIAQNGTYSALLFDAEYKLVFPTGQGPFRTVENSTTGSDTILVNLNGSETNLDIEVEPYYMVRNAQFSSSGRNVTANFQAEQIVTDLDARDIEHVNLYVGKTQFVDFRTNIASAEIGGGDIANPASISMTTTVPELTPTQNYVYARVGIKIVDREDMIFSAVQKVDL